MSPTTRGEHALSDVDLAFLAVEPQLLIVAVLLFGEPASGEDLQYADVERGVAARLDGTPWLRMRLDRDRKRWERDPDFELSRHVRLRSTSEPLDRDELMGIATALSKQPLDLDRPPWTIDVVPQVEGASLALILVVHHVVGHGGSLTRSIASLLFNVQPRSPKVSPAPLPHRPGTGAEPEHRPRRRRRWNRDVTLAVAGAAARVGRRGELIVRLASMGDIPTARRHDHVDSAIWEGSLLRLKLLSRAFDVTVTDVMTTALAGGLAKVNAESVQVRDFAKVLVPVDVRAATPQADQDFGNRPERQFVTAPLAHDSPLATLRAVSESSRVAKGAGDASTIAEIERLITTRRCAWLRSRLRRLLRHDVTVSSVSGPPIPVWLFDSPLIAAYATSTFTDTDVAKVTIFTQLDHVGVWIMSCPSCAGPVQTIHEGFTQTIDALFELQRRRTAIEAQPVFSGLSPQTLDRLAAAATDHAAQSGDVIVAAGGPPDAVFVIESGACEVTIGERAVNRLKAGDSFGEIAVVLSEPRTATVTALTPVHLIRIPASVVEQSLQDDLVAFRQASGVAQRLRARR